MAIKPIAEQIVDEFAAEYKRIADIDGSNMRTYRLARAAVENRFGEDVVRPVFRMAEKLRAMPADMAPR